MRYTASCRLLSTPPYFVSAGKRPVMRVVRGELAAVGSAGGVGLPVGGTAAGAT